MHGNSSYTPEIAERICTRLAMGESLARICKDRDQGFPNRLTVFQWLRKFPEFEVQYRQAREFHIDGVEDEILDMADNTEGDTIEWLNPKTGEMEVRTDHENINRSRLKVDTRKWWLGKQRPKKYGDKVTQEVSGPDGKDLVTVDKETIARWLAFNLAKPAEQKAS